MKFNALLATGLFIGEAAAHGPIASRSEVQRRGAMGQKCARASAELNEKRYAKRMAKRAAEKEKRWAGSGNATFEITTEAPYYEVIQNDTCVLTPDITQGPYIWPRSETLRQDMTEDQVGIPLWLDIGLLDMSTCEPLPNALVSFWHCNATGSYSSFTGLDPNTRFEELLSDMNITNFQDGTTDLHTDDSTWLRGMWPTDDNGMMEMKTIFPGFYIERAIHIHAEVYTNWTLAANGTVRTGDIHSVGQLFFTEEIEEQIMALEPYVSHTQINRTLNSEDSLDIFGEASAGGYSPIVNIVPADGEDVANGMIGYITMGVDTTTVLNLTALNEV